MNKCIVAALLLGTQLVPCSSVFADTVATNATVDADAPTGETWSIPRFQHEFCGDDSWEPFNRTMFGIFDWCMEYVADPFCYLYSSIIPKPLIKGIDNFSNNLEEPCAIFSNLFMGEWLAAWDETRRFFINSTLGIGGLFDPSEDWFYIFASNASLSDTFTRWGIPAGPQLALPFLPRSSVRGHVGYILDFGFDLKTYINFCVPGPFENFNWCGYSWFIVPNKAPVWRGRWEGIFGHTEDHYAMYMPIASAMNDFNLRQFAWNYYENQFNRSYARMVAKRDFAEGSPEQEEMFEKAEECFPDARPPIHPSATKPEGLKGDWVDIPGFSPRGPALDSFRALCFAPVGDDDFWWERRSIFCRDFSKSIDEREIVISNGLPKAVYSFVAQREPEDGEKLPEKLAIVLPGISAGRTSAEVVAMAELLNQHGYAVVMGDSLFHWEHVRSVNHGILPGNLAEDMKRYADYLGMILDDLKADELVSDPEISVLGWSMGGLTTASMAALDDAGEMPIRVKHFISINPPVSMKQALAKFNPVVEESRQWTRDDARKMFTEVAPSLYGWAAQDHPRYDPANPPVDVIGDPWNYAPNLTEKQANYLLGMTMRVIFPALIAERHKIAPFPWIESELTWFHRRKFYEEIGDISMEEYIHKYVPTCYDGVTAEEMIASADIRRLESAMVRNTKLTVLHTWNDLLEDDADRWYLDRIFGKRITWFADGGHCGYFYTKPFETELLRRLAE